MGWATDPTRKQETLFTTPILQMGARVYLPTLGRFLQVDPVDQGTANFYVYANDPVNQSDYSGEFWGFVNKAISTASNVVRVVKSVAKTVKKTARTVRNAANVAYSYFHYLAGGGRSRKENVGNYNWDKEGIARQGVNNSNAKNQGNGSHSISQVVSGNEPSGLPGQLIHGNVNFKVQGTITIDKKNWHFNGKLTPEPGLIYDFNASTHRSSFKEGLTTAGRVGGAVLGLCGIFKDTENQCNYSYNLEGSLDVNLSGRF